MSQKIEEIKYCPAGHSSEDFAYTDCQNFIFSDGKCVLCTKEYFIQEFKTWSSGNFNIDKIIQESQINSICDKLQWMPYDNFQNIEHIADGGHGSVNSAKLKNGIKWNWNFIKKDWEYVLIGYKVALKEIKDSRYDIVEFLKVVNIVNKYEFARYYGVSKNPSTQNYIIVMELFDIDLNKFLTKNFWDLKWLSKLEMLSSIAEGLGTLHQNNLVHYGLHSGIILKLTLYNDNAVYFDLDLLDNNVMQQLKIADENQKNTSKSQRQELFELFSHSSKLHPQSCYISRYIYTLHRLHDLLEEIKSGKSSDPNILKFNKSTTLNVNANMTMHHQNLLM
ncbi:3645_t:CDS:2 [Diversispora eburnea]|uniref:3645_t:CDS:1 n=1 Tax=Diversispora eburnea TaxID=1213867 RepID=A0A9N9BLC3_9GLOM|nr:3645_t:CDS:2 [Diversispora eburnea]